MSPTSFHSHILHVFSVLLLTGYTFYAFASTAPESRRKVMTITGIASLAVILSGLLLLRKMQFSWAFWIYIKVAAWLVISALSGVAYRRREKANLLALIAAAALLAAVYAVYAKPV